MIIDTLNNASKYFSLNPNFEEAFNFIQSKGDFKNETETEFQISDNLKAFVANFEGETIENASEKFECHNKNIDIQYCIENQETFGWKPRENCENVKDEYNAEKDVMFFNEQPDMYFSLKPNQFVIFFPEDVHAPNISPKLIKKLVIKVKINNESN
jgi:biofilm protein TabA